MSSQKESGEQPKKDFTLYIDVVKSEKDKTVFLAYTQYEYSIGLIQLPDDSCFVVSLSLPFTHELSQQNALICLGVSEKKPKDDAVEFSVLMVDEWVRKKGGNLNRSTLGVFFAKGDNLNKQWLKTPISSNADAKEQLGDTARMLQLQKAGFNVPIEEILKLANKKKIYLSVFSMQRN